MAHQIAATNTNNDAKGTILIVDDNRNNREMFKMCLELEGYSVYCACDGSEGLKKLGSVEPDVILLDMMMPVMDGRQMLEKVRKDFGLLDLPVMMLSVKSDTNDVADALEMGANDYLRKPFDIDELVARVNNLAKIRHCTQGAFAPETATEPANHGPAGALAAATSAEPLRCAAHDFNNLLFQVVGHVELAMMGLSEAPNVKTNLEKALSAARQAEKMARHICELARNIGK